MKAPDSITISATKITNAAIKPQCQFIPCNYGGAHYTTQLAEPNKFISALRSHHY
jgi:hypothetical protein